MIHTLKVTNFRGDSILFDFDHMLGAELVITGIKGVGPNKADINTVEIATDDGAVYNSARVPQRNIVIDFAFDGADVEALRQRTYRYFPLKKNVTLEFQTDHRHCRITGYVESNEPNIFQPNETAQISIICPFPYFTDADNLNGNTVFYGEEPVFEFPFGNESDEPLLEFGLVNRVTAANILYEGDAEVGMTITAHALGDVSNISIFDLDTGDSMTVRTNLIAGDDLVISTVKSKKFIRLLRNGVYTNLLNALDRDSKWIQLKMGDNALAYSAETGLNNLEFQVHNDVLYEGI